MISKVRAVLRLILYLQHVVAHIQIVGKLLAKSKQYQRQPSPFIQMQICLLIKRKGKIGKFMVKLTILCYDKKPTSLESYGMAAIPKIIFTSDNAV